MTGLTTSISRADLLRLAEQCDDHRLARLAPALGYAAPKPPSTTNEQPAGMSPGQAAASREPVPSPPSAIRHYRVVARERTGPPPTQPEPDQPPEPQAIDAPVQALGPAPELVPWPRLWPLLRAALSQRIERRRIDAPRLVRDQARLRPTRRLPRLTGRAWAARCQLILHLPHRLYPFWTDFGRLPRRLATLRGDAGLEILRMDQGPDGAVLPWTGDGWGRAQPYRAPAPDCPVVIVGDLGCLGPEVEREAWREHGLALRRQGQRPLVLSPCPSRWWDPRLAGLYFPVVLERDARLPSRPVGGRPWPAHPPDTAAAIAADAGARRLLALLAPGIGIRPALLRHLRQQLRPALGVGSEAAAWLHPAMTAGAFALIPRDAAAIEQLCDDQRAHIDDAERELAWGLIRAQREAQQARRSVRVEEQIRWRAVRGSQTPDPEAEHFQRACAEALAAARGQGDPDQAEQLSAHVRRQGGRMPPSGWRRSPATEALYLLACPEIEQDPATVPAGLSLTRARRGLGRPAQPRTWRLRQLGADLALEPEPTPAADCDLGNPLADGISTRHGAIELQRLDAQGEPIGPARGLPLNDGIRWPSAGQGWQLDTGDEQLRIEGLQRPPWASAIGRDADGLFVTVDDGDGTERRLNWWPLRDGWPQGLANLPPGPEPPPPLVAEHAAEGFFIDADQHQALREHGPRPSAPGERITRDRYGLRSELTIAGIPVAFRWIWPGSFQMGSPHDEDGRDDDETPHPVILTRGYWLAEIACTQALWQAVMGDNPSHNKGDDQRPVESVSWDEAQRFIAKAGRLMNPDGTDAGQRLLQGFGNALRGLIGRPPRSQAPHGNPGGGAPRHGEDNASQPPRSTTEPRPLLRLPTEAEWEYACRATTQTAYEFGSTFDDRRANNGSETVPVGTLPPNRWGLYEMHGNVVEWCQDWFGDYPQGTVVDPQGPEAGVYRVLRSGGWLIHPRGLRSACRGGIGPGGRYWLTGLRLARGPELAEPSKQHKQPGRAGPHLPHGE